MKLGFSAGSCFSSFAFVTKIVESIPAVAADAFAFAEVGTVDAS